MWPAVPAITYFILALFVLVSPSLAQSPEPAKIAVEEQAETATFKSAVSTVRIDVQVLQENNLVHGLTAGDLTVYDEGSPQQIVYFGREAEPLHLVLLLDISGSMKTYVEQVATVAKQSLRFLRPRDKVAVMPFARFSKVSLPFTEDQYGVSDAIRGVLNDETLGAATTINESLMDAIKYIEQSADQSGRRAILILTDNEGLNYRRPDEEVVRALGAANTVLNAIVVGKGKRPDIRPGVTYKNPDFTPPDVFKISEDTGGEAVKATEAGAAFSRMIERIRTRYTVHFNKPEHAKPGFHEVRVELTAAAKLKYPNAVVKSRRGYVVGGLAD